MAIEERIREVIAANSKVRDANAWWKLAAGKTPDHFHSESVVAQKDIANAGDQNAGRSKRLHFFGGEKEPMTGLAQHAQILPGIVLQHHSQVKLALVILLDGFDERRSAIQRQIENIAARAGPQPDAIALLELHAQDRDTLGRRLLFKKLPLPFVHDRTF